MNEVQIAIKRLYQIFGHYTTDGIHHCDCGCISADDVAKLNSKSLEALTAEDLSAYHMSAMSTWGDVVHYKHYLPRICECISTDRTQHYLTMPQFLDKLEYAKWGDWPQLEIEAIVDYVAADWSAINNSIDVKIDIQVLSLYNRVINLNDLLLNWPLMTSDVALKNFVNFYYEHGNQLMSGRVKVFKDNFHETLRSWLKSNNLLKRLESYFFEIETYDSNSASKVSVVMQMIEQE